MSDFNPSNTKEAPQILNTSHVERGLNNTDGGGRDNVTKHLINQEGCRGGVQGGLFSREFVFGDISNAQNKQGGFNLNNTPPSQQQPENSPETQKQNYQQNKDGTHQDNLKRNSTQNNFIESLTDEQIINTLTALSRKSNGGKFDDQDIIKAAELFIKLARNEGNKTKLIHEIINDPELKIITTNKDTDDSIKNMLEAVKNSSINNEEKLNEIQLKIVKQAPANNI